MSAHVLSNILKEMGKETKSEACQAFYRFFYYEVNKLNNTGAQMLDSIYHMPLKLIVFLMWKCQNFAMLWVPLHNRGDFCVHI